MKSKKYDFPKMDDSFLVPAPTISIPMPRGAAVPARQETHEGVVLTLVASADPAHSAAG